MEITSARAGRVDARATPEGRGDRGCPRRTARPSGGRLPSWGGVAVAIAQILYLLSRNVTVLWSPHFDLRFHREVFWAGSPGNCLGPLPGNAACREQAAAVGGLQPALQALLWIQALALFAYLEWGERRRQRLLILAAWLCACLATMGKGVAGMGLPVLCALGYLALTRRWRDFGRLEITAGVLILAITVLPWFVAMVARHGQPFTDRLLFHDMVKRASSTCTTPTKGMTPVSATTFGNSATAPFPGWGCCLRPLA